MKVIVATTVLSLLLASPTYGQMPTDISGTSVKSIRRIAKSRKLLDNPGVEIELFNPKGFYVGAMYWCLRIGKLQGIREGGGSYVRSYDLHRRRIFVLSTQEWKKLKTGDPLWLTWGCP